MKNMPIAKIMEDTIRNLNKPEKEIELKEIETYINIIIRYCNKLVDRNEGIQGEDLHYIILEDLHRLSAQYCDTCMLGGILFQLEAVKRLIGNREKIAQIYNKVKEKSFDKDQTYNINIEQSYEKVVIQALKEIKDTMDLVKDREKTVEIFRQYVNGDKAKRALLIERNSELKLNKIEEMLRIIVDENYINKINEQLKLMKKYLEVNLKQKQIGVMQFMGEFFEKFGHIDRYVRSNNIKTKDTTQADLSYSKRATDKKKDPVGVEDMFSKDFLEEQDLETILIYSFFWQNRFAKECKGMNKAIFAITDLKIWDDIAKGETDFKISRKQLLGICKKQKTLEKLIAQLFLNIRDNIDFKKISKEELEKGYSKIDPTDIIIKYDKQEGKKYKETFSELLPETNNDLIEDMEEYRTLINQKENIYKVKNSMLVYKILELFDSKKTKNWGIIPEEKNAKDRILIGIDYEGINMPLRLHMNREILIKVLQIRTGNFLLPVYEGYKDFLKEEEVISTQLLMPISKKNKSSVKERIKELRDSNNIGEELNYLEHLQFLSDGDKYPNHLRKDGKRPPRTYINIKTGELYKRENDSFVKKEMDVQTDAR